MEPDEHPTAGKQTILIIDDEEVVRVLFRSLLEDEGYTTLLAENGQQGIELLNQHQPAVALVDKNLPDMSGLELITSQKKRCPDIEFIMITGYASLDSAVKAMQAGAFSYLTKPFDDMDSVMDRIRAALEISNLREETSLLRERLNKLPYEPPVDSNHLPSTSGVPERMAEQIQRTIFFLESFLGKRDHPPPPSVWARMVDMIEEEHRRLKRVLQGEDQPQE